MDYPLHVYYYLLDLSQILSLIIIIICRILKHMMCSTPCQALEIQQKSRQTKLGLKEVTVLL